MTINQVYRSAFTGGGVGAGLDFFTREVPGSYDRLVRRNEK